MMPVLLKSDDTRWLCERAKHLGFELCGVAPTEKFPELGRYPEWLERGYAGEMKYLSDPRRLDPKDAMSGVRSLIVCALNYNAKLPYSTDIVATGAGENPRGWVSRYAWGDDYHEVLRSRLNALIAEMRMQFAHAEPFDARAYADTGPVHERAAAKYAGLGWLGKNTLLINQRAGSWIFLGVILTSLPLIPTLAADEMPAPDRCGTCRACLDACPTDAIVEPYVLDATRCISYLTIEYRGLIAQDLRVALGHHVFGCDICQDVCPWNRKSPRSDLQEFQPRKFGTSFANTVAEDSLFRPELLRLASLSELEFREKFRGSPIKRAKWRGLMRNACIALGNSGLTEESSAYPEALNSLRKLSESSDAVMAESARWALSRIQPAGNHSGGD
jgi:epoxyqueuosine reductase